MNRESYTPNIVVDDNYRMLVNRLTRRYAGRNAAVCADAEIIEQERSDARARAIAPDAYRISSVVGDTPDMYKSETASGTRHMTTDDYMTYFAKCHDTFDAINYCTVHTQSTEPLTADGEPRVLVNRKRLERIKGGSIAKTPASRVRSANASESKTAQKSEQVPKKTQELNGLARFGYAKGRAFTAFAAVAASIAIIVGSAIAIVPSDEVNNYVRSIPPEEEIVNLAEVEGQEILQNRE